jgi:hypothetical protein
MAETRVLGNLFSGSLSVDVSTRRLGSGVGRWVRITSEGSLTRKILMLELISAVAATLVAPERMGYVSFEWCDLTEEGLFDFSPR